jgi:hypothetical protein
MLLARVLVPLLMAGCLCSAQGLHAPATLPTAPQHTTTAAVAAAVTATAKPFAAPALDTPSTCSGAFVTHRLDFATGARLREIGTYISNGSGVAANDLDNDGDLDLAFASVDGQAAILWNEGELKFTREPLDASFGRGVTILDVDGDGWRDIVFTHRGLEAPSFWLNVGDSTTRPHFERTILPGIDHYAYAMAWGDVNGDGMLELVTGSYAAELTQHGIASPEQEPKAGVVLHFQRDDGWEAQLLDNHAETLSIAIVDITGDGAAEIWAANDFALDDKVWQHTGDRWEMTHPFVQTSYSTMNTEWGSLANDGRLALFTTDMNPYDISPRNLAAWVPVLNQLVPNNRADEVQVMANMLLIGDGRGGWQNQATARGVDASGWSWAARFGDLDQDGYLDLYIVNGMIAADLFGHLPNSELVEENQAYRNRGDGSFDQAPQWQLGATASGRGMVMADMDNDGDLDIVVNNLRGFAQLHENQLCTGASLQVDLAWPGSQNQHGIGAQLALYTDAGVLRRDVRASGGYLSGDPARAHFGFPAGATLHSLEVIWPDGARSVTERMQANTLLTITRTNEEALQ